MKFKRYKDESGRLRIVADMTAREAAIMLYCSQRGTGWGRRMIEVRASTINKVSRRFENGIGEHLIKGQE